MKKPSFMYRQSGVVPLVSKAGTINVVLVTSTRTGKWGFPKGVIEKGMSAAQSAMKEAFEEAGVLGSCSGDEIGTYEYEKWDGICRVQMYLMIVESVSESWDEQQTRNRVIVDVRHAHDLIGETALSSILNAAVNVYADTDSFDV